MTPLRSARVSPGGHAAGIIVVALPFVGACAPADAGVEPQTTSVAEAPSGERPTALVTSTGVLAEGEIEVRLEVPSRPLRASELRSELRVFVTNASDGPIAIAAPGDGSKAAWRTPAIGWSVLPGDSDAPRPKTPDRVHQRSCGFMNAFDESELIELAAGASTEFSDRLVPPSLKPGTHRVAFHYRNDPDNTGATGFNNGVRSQITADDVRNTTRCEGWSSEILVSIVE